jgi:hypothetical protein
MVLLCWGVGLAVMMPWFAFNLSRFEEPSLMTAQTGAVLSAANCDTTFYGDYIGYYANCYDEYVASGRLVGDPALPNCTPEAAAAASSPDEETKKLASGCWTTSAPCRGSRSPACCACSSCTTPTSSTPPSRSGRTCA